MIPINIWEERYYQLYFEYKGVLDRSEQPWVTQEKLQGQKLKTGSLTSILSPCLYSTDGENLGAEQLNDHKSL